MPTFLIATAAILFIAVFFYLTRRAKTEDEINRKLELYQMQFDDILAIEDVKECHEAAYNLLKVIICDITNQTVLSDTTDLEVSDDNYKYNKIVFVSKNYKFEHFIALLDGLEQLILCLQSVEFMVSHFKSQQDGE